MRPPALSVGCHATVFRTFHTVPDGRGAASVAPMVHREQEPPSGVHCLPALLYPYARGTVWPDDGSLPDPPPRCRHLQAEELLATCKAGTCLVRNSQQGPVLSAKQPLAADGGQYYSHLKVFAVRRVVLSTHGGLGRRWFPLCRHTPAMRVEATGVAHYAAVLRLNIRPAPRCTTADQRGSRHPHVVDCPRGGIYLGARHGGPPLFHPHPSSTNRPFLTPTSHVRMT